MAAQERVGAVERYPAVWRITSDRALPGAVAVTFTSSGSEPGADAEWLPATWLDQDQHSQDRQAQVMLAGSAARQPDDVHPGVGWFTAWLMYSDNDIVRVRAGGLLEFQ